MEEPKSRNLLLCALGCTCVAWTVFSYLCDIPLGYGRGWVVTRCAHFL